VFRQVVSYYENAAGKFYLKDESKLTKQLIHETLKLYVFRIKSVGKKDSKIVVILCVISVITPTLSTVRDS